MTVAETRIEEGKSASAEPTPLTQISIKNVLYATDFSPTSNGALPYATAICRCFGATLHTVHVLSEASTLLMAGGTDYVSLGTLYDDAQNAAKERLEQISAGFEGIRHHNYVGHGPVWGNLHAILQKNEIDLIVVGTHGRTGLGKLLLGSVAEDILRHAPCPVLTIGPNITGRAKLPTFPITHHDLAPAELDVRQIVFATNFAYDAAAIAQATALLAANFGARLTLVHVIEDHWREPWTMGEGIRRLKNLVPPATVPCYTPEAVLEFGSAWARIVNVASERDADVIVLGARPAASVGSTHFPWSTAHQVIAHAPCPVLTIRG
jgi:nucleotide-binding universal stress UspA family protein